MRAAVYCSRLGDYFFQEIADLLAAGLEDLGAEVARGSETGGFLADVDWHLVVAPQQFFFLGDGARLRVAPWPEGVVLYNAEQPTAEWFPLVRRLLTRAHAVWEADFSQSQAWRREGQRAAYVPMGWAPGAPFLQASSVLPRHSERPIDVLFAGSRVPRRERFFESVAPYLRRYRIELRLVSDNAFLRKDSPRRMTEEMLGLARRAKIVLNVHREAAPYFEWHRVAMHGVGQGAFVVSETATAAPPLVPGRDFAALPLEKMADALRYYLSTDQGRIESERIAAQGHRTYSEQCRLAGFLRPAVDALGDPSRRSPTRTRVEAAMDLLRERSPALVPGFH